MKDNKIDEIFRDKLGDLEKSPGLKAWNKINEQLHDGKKPTILLWWHRAAIILVLCLSGFLIFLKMNMGNNDQQNNLVGLKPNHSEKPAINSTTNIAEDRSNSTESNINNEKHDAVQKEIPVPVEPKTYQSIAQTKKSKAPQPEINISAIQDNLHEEVKELPKIKSGHSTIMNTSLEADEKIVAKNKSTPPITIELKSGKNSLKESLLADADAKKVKEDQSFNFKKLLSKVKEGEIGLADIRQAKDDLFAFDTFKENSKRTNK